MGNSYQSSVLENAVNMSAITSILTANQNVVSATAIVTQTQYITIGTVNCTNISFINNADITVTITGQMTAQTANDITNYLQTSVSNSMDQSAKVVTELFGVYGGNEQIAQIKNTVNDYINNTMTTTNLQSVMASVRVTQMQSITIGTLTGSMCNFTNNVLVALSAQAIMDSLATNTSTNTEMTAIANAMSQYYSATAKGLNSLISDAILAAIIPIIIVVVVVIIIIIIIVVVMMMVKKKTNGVVNSAKQLFMNPNDPNSDSDAIAALQANAGQKLTTQANQLAQSRQLQAQKQQLLAGRTTAVPTTTTARATTTTRLTAPPLTTTA